MNTRLAVRRRVVTALVLALGAVAVAACGSDATVRSTDDGKITVKGSGKKAEVTIKGDGSDLTFNQQKIPAGFPSDVPLPKGLTRLAATSGTAQAKPLFQVSYGLGSETGTDALATYQHDLETAGFTIDQPVSSDNAGSNSVITMSATGKGWQVSTANIPGPQPQTIVISVTK